MNWFWAGLTIYMLVALFIFLFHMFALQMVTFPLALLRSIFWPLWWAGFLQGTPLMMD